MRNKLNFDKEINLARFLRNSWYEFILSFTLFLAYKL